MTNPRKFTTPKEFIAALKQQAQAPVAPANSSQRTRQVAHCEDFYAKLDVLLATDNASRQAAAGVLSRMAGSAAA